MLAETSSIEISRSRNQRGFDNAKNSVVKGGGIAKIAKDELEKETGNKVVTSKNAKELRNENINKLLNS